MKEGRGGGEGWTDMELQVGWNDNDLRQLDDQVEVLSPLLHPEEWMMVWQNMPC